LHVRIKGLIIRAPDEACKYLSLPKMPSGANAFEISDIQEDEAEAVLRRTECNNALHRAENLLMELRLAR
jgi:hypothetical protein